MNNKNAAESESIKDRPERFTSHALVEVRRFRWLPMGTHSAVLLDISLSGLKIEFTGEVSARLGDKYWLHIPLTPLGIYAPSRLFCQAECKWFDDKRYRFGGVFTGLKSTDYVIIEQIIETLRLKGETSL